MLTDIEIEGKGSIINSEESGVNIKDNNGFNALMVACKKGNKDVVQLLLDNSERHIDLNARNNGGLTAFMLACARGHTNVVQLLLDNLERNIDLNARSSVGRTALMFACLN